MKTQPQTIMNEPIVTNTRYKYIDNDEDQHLHTLDLIPLIGTSTVLNILSKPLTWWASGLAVAEFGWMNPKKTDEETRMASVIKGFEMVKNLSIEEYDKLLTKAYYAHSKKLDKSAKEGTDLHSQLEFYVKNHILYQKSQEEFNNKAKIVQYDDRIKFFIEWTEANVKRFLWSEGHCFSEKYWLGGKCDAGAELKNGEYAIIDFKSSKEAYHSQFWQIGGYNIEISENGVFDKDGNLIYTLDKPITQHIVIPFGAETIQPFYSKDVEKDKKAYIACLEVYKHLNNIV